MYQSPDLKFQLVGIHVPANQARGAEANRKHPILFDLVFETKLIQGNTECDGAVEQKMQLRLEKERPDTEAQDDGKF